MKKGEVYIKGNVLENMERIDRQLKETGCLGITLDQLRQVSEYAYELVASGRAYAYCNENVTASFHGQAVSAQHRQLVIVPRSRQCGCQPKQAYEFSV